MSVNNIETVLALHNIVEERRGVLLDFILHGQSVRLAVANISDYKLAVPRHVECQEVSGEY